MKAQEKVRKTTINKLFNGEPVKAHGSYYIVGYPRDDGSIKLRIDRLSAGSMVYGASVIFAHCDEENRPSSSRMGRLDD